MSELQLFVANLVNMAVLLILVGLIARKRAHLCWSFTIYLAAILVGNSLVLFWPATFYTRWFYILKESVYNIVTLCLAAEMTYRVFRAFPGALARARVMLAPMLALITIGVISVPTGIDYVDFVTRYHPQIQTGVIWLLSATAVLAVWYNIPLNRIHRGILLGMSSYLIVFATLSNAARSFGYERTRELLSAVDSYAYLALVAWWAVRAWRSDETAEVTAVRAQELAPKPA